MDSIDLAEERSVFHYVIAAVICWFASAAGGVLLSGVLSVTSILVDLVGCGKGLGGALGFVAALLLGAAAIVAAKFLLLSEESNLALFIGGSALGMIFLLIIGTKLGAAAGAERLPFWQSLWSGFKYGSVVGFSLAGLYVLITLAAQARR